MYDQRNLFTVASWTRPSKDLGKNCVACSGGGGGGAGRGRGHGHGSAYWLTWRKLGKVASRTRYKYEKAI